MSKNDSAPQVAALAYRDEKICLVTTRSGKGLIIPKGHVPTGASPAEFAAREAWEEAGLVGEISPRPFGKYKFEKSDRIQKVHVFLLAVTKMARIWPEQQFRQRLWFSLEEAIPRVTHLALRDLLKEFAESEFYTRVSVTRRRRESA